MATTKSAPFTRPSRCTTVWKSAFPKPAKGIAVECDNPAIPGGQGNLVYRTCEAWAQARGWRGGIQVQIEKVIPLGSGLGGASTNAAATILGLERLTGDRLDFPARQKLAAALGF